MKPLTREQDKAAWVLARLEPSTNRRVMLVRFTALGIDYERIHPFDHVPPGNVISYGQRLPEKALALHAR